MERKDLFAGLVAGDESAWREFVLEFGSLMHAIGARLGLSEADREDAFQSACLAAVRHIHKLREPEKLASWIYGITLRTGLDLRRRSPPEISIKDAGGPEVLFEVASEEPSALESLKKLDETARLYDALSKLDPSCRRLLSAIYLSEPQASYQEVSHRVGIPIGSIGPSRGRCLEKLKKLLGDVSEISLEATSSQERRHEKQS